MIRGNNINRFLRGCSDHRDQLIILYVKPIRSLLIQRTPGLLHSKGEIRVFLLQEELLALVVHSVGVSEYGHYTAQAQESLSNFGATNKAAFILGR